MKIKLKGHLDRELKAIGLKAGDIIENASAIQTNGAVHFEKTFRKHIYNCSVWPDNYQVISKRQEKKINQKAYAFYVVNPKTLKIITGWEFQSDAKDFVAETNPNLKIYTKTHLVGKLKINPDDNAFWSGSLLGKVQYEPIEEKILYGFDSKQNLVPELEIKFNKSFQFGQIRTSDQLYEVLVKIYGDKIDLQEQFVVLLLDNQNNVNGFYKHSIGTYESAVVDIPMIFGMILKTMSRAFIVSHNHPSGNTIPSKKDLEITASFEKAAKALGLVLKDHIIVTRTNGYYSFKEKNILNGLVKKFKAAGAKAGAKRKAAEMADKRIHIIKRGYGWAHKKEGNQKASTIAKSKDEAIKIAAPLKKKGYDIIIHKEDGSIEKWEKAEK